MVKNNLLPCICYASIVVNLTNSSEVVEGEKSGFVISFNTCKDPRRGEMITSFFFASFTYLCKYE